MRGRPWRTALSLLLCAGVWVGSASAAGVYRNHRKETPKLEAGIAVSPWAGTEVDRAVEIGICPWKIEDSPPDMSAPAPRLSCISYLSRLIACQQNCDPEELDRVVLHCYGKAGEEGEERSVFSDLRYPGVADAMYYLGVARGREDGSFDPNGTLTRQEAATFLARTYRAYGGELPAVSETPPFTDWDQVADWAVGCKFNG